MSAGHGLEIQVHGIALLTALNFGFSAVAIRDGAKNHLLDRLRRMDRGAFGFLRITLEGQAIAQAKQADAMSRLDHEIVQIRSDCQTLITTAEERLGSVFNGYFARAAFLSAGLYGLFLIGWIAAEQDGLLDHSEFWFGRCVVMLCYLSFVHWVLLFGVTFVSPFKIEGTEDPYVLYMFFLHPIVFVSAIFFTRGMSSGFFFHLPSQTAIVVSIIPLCLPFMSIYLLSLWYYRWVVRKFEPELWTLIDSYNQLVRRDLHINRPAFN
ncbi:MAG: hypothetical protein ABI432_16855 [Flavobacteriales bacterium]